MASILPASLRTGEIQRFVHRATQLEKPRPIVAYWCEYYVLQQILGRELHKTDDACAEYAMQLMDKLESYKAAHPEDEAVSDDVAAKAYIEAFALQVFGRGEEQQRTNKVTAQTADTFQAANTFMDLLTIWAPLDEELAAKKKFAKFHALRIAKAIKAGEDPNATNPHIEPPPLPEVAGEAALEEELTRMENEQTGSAYQPPTVEHVPENGTSPHPSSMPTATNAALPVEPEVSPIESSEKVNSRAGSIGGGYFPAVSTDPPGVTFPATPGAPETPSNFYATGPPPAVPTLHDLGFEDTDPVSHPPPAPTIPPPSALPPPGISHASVPIPAPAAAPTAAAMAISPVAPVGGYRTDDESVIAATKHAKWAISALNFEDVATAVKELKIALQSLGAS